MPWYDETVASNQARADAKFASDVAVWRQNCQTWRDQAVSIIATGGFPPFAPEAPKHTFFHWDLTLKQDDGSFGGLVKVENDDASLVPPPLPNVKVAVASPTVFTPIGSPDDNTQMLRYLIRIATAIAAAVGAKVG